MKLQKDLKEFIELLNSMNVRYVLIGGHAVTYHGFPRFTADTDFFVGSSPHNLKILAEAMGNFGFGSLGKELLSASPGTLFQMGRPPYRIDLLMSIDGVDFEEAWKTREVAVLDGVEVGILSRSLLLENKRASGRPKDLEDVRQLGG